MAESFHGRGRTKHGGTGGKRKKHADKKLSQAGGAFAATKVAPSDVRKLSRMRGGKVKVKLKRAAFASVLTKEGMKKSKIKRVLESPDNRHYARMNVITKGCIIETELGKARVTNRPGQTGVVSATLLS